MTLKKLFTGLISLAAALIAICAVTVCAGAQTSGDYEYKVLDNGTVEITDYTGDAAKLSIPATLGGKKVTGIGEKAFSDCDLTSVTVPNGVTSIGDGAFAYCTSLAAVNMPDSLKNIGSNAFEFCISLTSITIPDNVTSIGYSAFYQCQSLSSVKLSKSLKLIDSAVFSNCRKLASITIPDSVKSIGNRAFVNCSKLASVSISKNVTSIEDEAFYCCESLKAITIPDSVKSIGKNAFCGCISLASVTVGSGISSVKYGAFLDTPFLKNQTADVKYLGKWVIGCNNTATATIKSGTVGIANNAFENCSSLTSINIPNGVKKIGYEAFRNCSSLKSITLPDSVTSIDAGAFYRCSRLIDVYYTGSKAQWSKIDIVIGSEDLTGANIHYLNLGISGLKLKGRAADALRISWDKNTNADGYIIEMKSGTKWVRVGKITKNSTVEFRKAGLKAGTAYSFRVKAYKMSGKTALYSGYTSISARTNPSSVTGLKLKGRAADALRISWAKNTSADGYIIEMKSGGKWVRVGKITNNTTVEFRKAGLKAGTAYSFRVKAYKMSGKTALYSGYKTISARTNPSAVSGLKLKASAKDAVRLSWAKNTSADGYIIEMKSGNTWTRAGKITKNFTIEFKKSGLKSKTSYSFRIKAYKMSGKTALYSGYTTITVKTK